MGRKNNNKAPGNARSPEGGSGAAVGAGTGTGTGTGTASSADATEAGRVRTANQAGLDQASQLGQFESGAWRDLTIRQLRSWLRDVSEDLTATQATEVAAHLQGADMLMRFMSFTTDPYPASHRAPTTAAPTRHTHPMAMAASSSDAGTLHREFTTSCGHVIKVKPVLKVGGALEGKWSARISGPLVTGKSGIKTVYSNPSVSAAKAAAAKFLRLSPHMLTEVCRASARRYVPGVDYSLRVAEPQDLPTLLQFEQGIVQWERPFAPNLKPDPVSYYDIAALMERDDAQVLVVVSPSGQLMGSGYAKIKRNIPYKQPDMLAYLGFMYIAPQHRGRGLNAAVIEGLKEWAALRGVHEVQLDVYADNTSALAAYEKAGFKPDMLTMRLQAPSLQR